MRAYRNMLSRVVGIQKKEAHYYEGLSILPQNVFRVWAVQDSAFQQLWAIWQKTIPLDRRLTPSIDRKDVLKGYILDNMQWVTHAVNSGRLTRRDNVTRVRGEAWYAAHPNRGRAA